MAGLMKRKTASGIEVGGGSPLVQGSDDLLHIRDEKAGGTDGGSFTSGSWVTRTLNTEVTNEIAGASLASNQITLPAGTYEVYGRVPAHAVNYHKARLWDVTNSITLIVGNTGYSNVAGYSDSDSILMGRFTLAGSTDIEVQHECSDTNSGGNGLGLAGADFGHVEIYTQVAIRKVSDAESIANALTIDNNATASAYTLVLDDAYSYIRFTDAGAVTLTVPTNAAVAFEIGTVIEVYAAGAGGVTIQGDTGVTVNGAGDLSENGAASLTKIAEDEWDATGALS